MLIRIANGLAVSLAVLAVGCDSDAEIRRYRVPKQSIVEQTNPSTQPEAPRPDAMPRPDAAAPGATAPRAAALSYDTPAGWSEQPAAGMRQAAFTVEDENQSAELTAIALGPEAGNVLDNVNRWRGQIGLPPVDAEQLQQEIEPVEVGGASGLYVELVGPADSSPRQSILGVIVVVEGRVWFLKFMGDADLVEQQQSQFDEFVQSVQWSGVER